jgi:hypothetical protein
LLVFSMTSVTERITRPPIAAAPKRPNAALWRRCARRRRQLWRRQDQKPRAPSRKAPAETLILRSFAGGEELANLLIELLGVVDQVLALYLSHKQVSFCRYAIIRRRYIAKTKLSGSVVHFGLKGCVFAIVEPALEERAQYR